MNPYVKMFSVRISDCTIRWLRCGNYDANIIYVKLICQCSKVYGLSPLTGKDQRVFPVVSWMQPLPFPLCQRPVSQWGQIWVGAFKTSFLWTYEEYLENWIGDSLEGLSIYLFAIHLCAFEHTLVLELTGHWRNSLFICLLSCLNLFISMCCNKDNFLGNSKLQVSAQVLWSTQRFLTGQRTLLNEVYSKLNLQP